MGMQKEDIIKEMRQREKGQNKHPGNRVSYDPCPPHHTTKKHWCEEKKYQEIFNNVNDAIYLHKLTDDEVRGTFIDVNAVASRMLGYSKKEFLSMSPKDIDGGETNITMAEIQSILQNEGHVTFQQIHVSKQGKRIPVEISSHLFSLKGEPLILSVARDITERKQAEERVKKEKETMELLQKTVPCAVFAVDTTKKIISWNKKAEELTGYTSEEIIGKPCTLFSQEPCNERCGLFSDHIIKPIQNKECSIVRKDGQRRIISKNVDVLKDFQGKIVGGIESFEDITQQKQAEVELVNQIKKMRLLYEIISKGVKTKNLPTFFQQTIDTILSSLSIDAGGVYLMDDTGDTASLVYSKQIPEVFLEKIQKIPLTQPPYNTLFKLQEPFVVNNYGERFPEHANISGFEAIVSLPIIAKETCVGAINFAKKQGGVFEETEVELLQTVAIEIGTVIQTIKYESALKNKLEELQRWKKVTVGRELKMTELKDQLKQLQKQVKQGGG